MDAWVGNEYASIADLQRSLASASLDSADWPRSLDTIDLGCGDGAVTALIAERTPAGSVLGSTCRTVRSSTRGKTTHSRI